MTRRGVTSDTGSRAPARSGQRTTLLLKGIRSDCDALVSLIPGEANDNATEELASVSKHKNFTRSGLGQTHLLTVRLDRTVEHPVEESIAKYIP
jgi:hypothetical protein